VQQQPMRRAFVDLTKAFDLVYRGSLFIVLQKAGNPSTLISLIKSFRHAMYGKICHNGGLSSSVDMSLLG